MYLFLFTQGANFRNDDLLLVRSTDRVRTWSDPVTLFKGHFWNCHTGMILHEGRLYWAVDEFYAKDKPMDKRSPRALVGDLVDPMNPESWRMSNRIPFPGLPREMQRMGWMPRQDGISPWPDHWLEPNIVRVGDRFRMLATVKVQRQTAAYLCAVFDVTEDEKGVLLDFRQFHSMPGGQLKFAIIHDDVSGYFWATANLVVDSQETLDVWGEARRARHFVSSGGKKIGGS